MTNHAETRDPEVIVVGKSSVKRMEKINIEQKARFFTKGNETDPPYDQAVYEMMIVGDSFVIDKDDCLSHLARHPLLQAALEVEFSDLLEEGETIIEWLDSHTVLLSSLFPTPIPPPE